MKQQSQKIKQLSTLIFKPLKLCECPQHASVHRQADLICLKSQCRAYMSLYCSDCTHSQSHLYEIQKIIPTISQLLQNKWEEIRKQNMEIQNIWRTCEVNLKYCIDILGEMRKMVLDSKTTRLHELPVFENILDTALQLYQKQCRVDDFTKHIQVLNDKYGIFNKIREKDKTIDSDSIDKDIQFRKKKWLKMGEKTKQFSQKALAFSQTIAQSIEDRLKYQRRKQHLNQLSANRMATLKQLLQQYKNSKNQESLSSKMEQISSLKIQLPSNTSISKSKASSSMKQKSQEQENYLEQNLQKCQNLSSLLINNKNGKIPPKMWEMMISKFQYLKNLKELRLHLRRQDLILLTKIFKEKAHAVRHIPILHLIITDEPNLDAKLVAQFCNTLQLRELYLTLTRDDINKNNFIQFLNVLRVTTSLSYLPLNKIQLNLTKNKIENQVEILECQKRFAMKCKQIKKKNIQL